MNREEIKAEALINLGSEPAPKEWEKLPCIKEQMPSCIGGEVSLQRFVGTDICAWFVGIGGLWEPQSEYFRVSLPPAEGAEAIKQALCDDINKLLNGAYLDKIFDSEQNSLPLVDYLSAAIPGNTIASGKKEIENIVEQIYFDMEEWQSLALLQQQPTAEGAEEIRKEYSEESLNFFRLFIKARKELCAISPTETYSLEESIRKAFDGFFPRPLSIVDDAETILNSHPYLKVWIENLYDSEMKVCSIEQAIWAIEKAATLHAQRIADKMVEERMEQYKAQFKDRPNPLEVNPYDSKGIKRIRNRKIH